MLVNKNIFDKLEAEYMSYNEKINLIKNYENIIISSLKRMSGKQILKYLFNYNIPNEAKIIISKFIDELIIDNKNIKKYEEIKSYFCTDNYFSKYIENKLNLSNIDELLNLDSIPNFVKEMIIDKNYNNIIEEICNFELSYEQKKRIIDIKHGSIDYCQLLSKLKEEQLVNYIICNKLNTNSELKKLLGSFELSEKTKKQIIDQKLNFENSYSIASYFMLDNNIKKYINQKKSKEIKYYIENIKSEKLLSEINNSCNNKFITDNIIEQRKDDINKLIKRTFNKISFSNFLLRSNNKKIIDLITHDYSNKTKFIIFLLDSNQVLDWLNNKNVPADLKEYIMKLKKFQINQGIKKLKRIDVIDLYFIYENRLPKEIKEKIFNMHKESIISKIQSYDEEKIHSKLFNPDLDKLIKELIIKIKVNENNIFKLLGDKFISKEIKEMIINSKKDILGQYLNNLTIDQLFNFKLLEDESILTKIIVDNEQIISKKLINLDEEILYDKLNSISVPISIKYIILKNMNISKDELKNYLNLLGIIDSKTLIFNYTNIKEFIVSSNIDFNVFIQYGCGTNKYKNWMIKILDIKNSNMISEFIKVKDFMFKNFYTDTKNEIQEITNYLDVIDNFYNYKDLLLNLTYNKALNESDKLNLNFVFKNKIKCSNIKEISNMRLKIYNDYKNKIYSSKSSLTDLRKICYDLFLKQSENILDNVGGSLTLIALKNKYKSSKNMSDILDELIAYSKLIDKLSSTQNINELRDILKKIFGDNTSSLDSFESIFLKLDKKILNFFEQDSICNLTKIESVRKDNILDIELSKEYGGEVFDFSDKNYCLYAHVLGVNEDVDDLILGKTDANKNFISVSPISYLGQKYHYAYSDMIVAYDNIPKGNFICSSVLNMGSNYSISRNSSEVSKLNKIQRGILETSAVTENNSEALLYREGLKPCGIILVDRKTPTRKELFYHEKYNLPFIITQPIMESIDNPKLVFNQSYEQLDDKLYTKELSLVLKNIELQNTIGDSVYTGREIAIITDCHSMYEPTLAVLEDIRKRDVREIYSLGDNVELGVNPDEVFDMLEDYNVKSISGNGEYYNTLGIEPFPYFNYEKIENHQWTQNKLGTNRINKMKLYPASKEIFVGDNTIALCHFVNDVRWDFVNRSTWTYQNNYKKENSANQFLYTNSKECINELENNIKKYNYYDDYIKGYLSSKKEPLFKGKKVTDYDAIFQGHVHFDMKDKLNNTDIYTLRAVGMGYGKDDKDKACYYLLKEKKDGTYDLEKKLVPFNKKLLISNIKTSSMPHKEKVLSFL